MAAEFSSLLLSGQFFFHNRYPLIHAAGTIADAITFFFLRSLSSDSPGRFWFLFMDWLGFRFALGCILAEALLVIFQRCSISFHRIWQAIC